MALFQPTNITPDIRGELGNGTVDGSGSLTVSWQVNGNVAMTAFSIAIYKNDSASTQVYTTGKLTTNCPFYGTDYNGDIVLFSYTISSPGLSNGNEYKLIITQYYSGGSVTQSSASVFQTRAAPSLSINNLPSSSLDKRSYTFTATYTQAQGDALNWVRWRLAYADDTDDPIYDTENIYGTAQLQFTYDGFFTGNTYAIRCTAQTSNGIDADTGWQTFSVSYNASPLTGAVTVTCTPSKSAVLVGWPAVSYMPGTASGTYTLSGGKITLPSGSSVLWDNVNNTEMSLAAPWSLFYNGILSSDSVTIVTIGTTNGDIVFSYSTDKFSLSLNGGESTATLSQNEILREYAIYAAVTPTAFVVRYLYNIPGLYPDDALYPSKTLYPDEDVVTAAYQVADLSYAQGDITSVKINGAQICDYLNIEQGEASQSSLTQVKAGTYEPTLGDSTLLLANFNAGLSAGNIGGETADSLVALAIYRRQQGSGVLQHIADLPLSTYQFYDYSVASQQGDYTYYLFPMGESTYIAEPISSESINPCFWNWTLLACNENSEGYFEVEQEFTFGKNLASGSISNNNTPNILKNFTRYPAVQMDSANYMSGTLTSLIGVIDSKTAKYSDTLSLRDAIYNLSTNSGPLFLKNRKGDLLRVAIAAETTMETMDDTREQAQTVSLSWVQIGDASTASIIQTS